jgi:hypothetical protein
MITIHFSLGLSNLTREWLPQRQRPALTLPRRQGRLLLTLRRRPTAYPQIGLVYLGLTGEQPRFRLDIQTDRTTHHREVVINDTWDIATLLAQEAELATRAKTLQLTIAVLEANAQSARVQLSTPLSLRYEAGGDTVGLTMSDLLRLPEAQSEFINWMLREGPVSLAAVAQYLEQTPDAARTVLQKLSQQGFLQELEIDGQAHYEPRLASTRSHRLSQALFETIAAKPINTPASRANFQQVRQESAFVQRLLDSLLGQQGRYVLGLVPVVLVFLVAEILLLTGRQTFSGPLSFIGVIAIAMLAGIFPVLLLQASRQKGEIVPEVVYWIIGNPILLIIIYLISLTGVILHGLVIWEDPVQRVLALVVAVVIVGVTLNSWRRGAFTSRLVVEVATHQGRDQSTHFSITAAGRPYATEVQLVYADERQSQTAARGDIANFTALQQATFTLPAKVAPELKVWAYSLTPEQTAETLPALATLQTKAETIAVDLKLTGGQTLLPLSDQLTRLTLTFSPDDVSS